MNEYRGEIDGNFADLKQTDNAPIDPDLEWSGVIGCSGLDKLLLKLEQIGSVCIGRYQLRETISIGKKSALFLAFDPKLEREVSIKIYHAFSTQTEDEENNLVFKEGRALACVTSPYVARCHNVESVGVTPYLVNEWIEGQTLEQYMAVESLTYNQVKAIFRKIVQGVDAIHHEGLLHRDIKPSNIVIDPSGNPKIIDLGLAEETDLSTHGIAGTVAYVAPEVIRGESTNIGPPSDVFGLGGVLYFLLTGHALFEADDKANQLIKAHDCEILDSHLKSGWVRTSLDRICMKCLSENPADRYPSTSSLYNAMLPRSKQRVFSAVGVCVVLIAVAYFAGWLPTLRNRRVPLSQLAVAAANDSEYEKAVDLQEQYVASIIGRESPGSVTLALDDLADFCCLVPDVGKAIETKKRKVRYEKDMRNLGSWVDDAKIELAEMNKIKKLDGGQLDQFATAKRLQFLGLETRREDPENSRAKLICAVKNLCASVGKTHLEYLVCLDNMAMLNIATNRLDKIEQMLAELEKGFEALYGPESVKLSMIWSNRAEFRLKYYGNPHRAIGDIDLALGNAKKNHEENDPRIIGLQIRRCHFLIKMRRYDEASKDLGPLVNRLESLVPTSVEYALALSSKSELLFCMKRYAECQETIDQVRPILVELANRVGKATLMLARINMLSARAASFQGNSKTVSANIKQPQKAMSKFRFGREDYYFTIIRAAIYLLRVGQSRNAATLFQQIDEYDLDKMRKKSELLALFAEGSCLMDKIPETIEYSKMACQHFNPEDFVSSCRVIDSFAQIATIRTSTRKLGCDGLRTIMSIVENLDKKKTPDQHYIDLADYCAAKIKSIENLEHRQSRLE